VFRCIVRRSHSRTLSVGRRFSCLDAHTKASPFRILKVTLLTCLIVLEVV